MRYTGLVKIFRTRALLSLSLAAGLAAALHGCDKPGSTGVDNTGPQHQAHNEPGASRPDLPPVRKLTGPRLDTACFDTYAECEPVIDLPALSADGERIAVPDFGPEDPRDEFVLTMRIIALDGSAEPVEMPIVTVEDHRRSADSQTGEFSVAFAAELEKRAAAFEQVLTVGEYRPLTSLGRVHQQRNSDPVNGLRASFDGDNLVIADVASGKVEWQQRILASRAFRARAGHDCGVFPVADIALWISRAPRVAVARVAFTGSERCEAAPFFVVMD